MDKPTLIIMCGLARSGKSTWIRENRPDVVAISPDKVRSEIFGHQFFANAEDFIWAMTKGMAKLILEQGKSVLIDATHTTWGSRTAWIRIAKQYNAEVEIVWIKTSLDECLERNEKSEDGQKLPEDVIERMATNFVDPWHDFDTDGIPIKLIQVPYSDKIIKGMDAEFSNYYLKEIVDYYINKEI